jgi:hypothetical protein
MAAYLYHPTQAAVSLTTLRSYVTSLPYVYLEGEQDVALVWTRDLLNGSLHPAFRPNYPDLASGAPLTLSAWTHGRAFGEAAELRWERIDEDSYRVALLTETPPDAAWKPAPEDFDEQWRERDVMLIGTRVDVAEGDALPAGHAARREQLGTGSPVWVETRYPRPLSYPVDPEVRQVYLYCRDYSVRSLVILTRLWGVGAKRA